MELTQISENGYLYNSRHTSLTSSMVVQRISDRDVVLIDCGCDPCATLFEELDRRDWHVHAALCTHLHWDHTGCTGEVSRRGGTVFAYAGETKPYIYSVPKEDGYITFLDATEITFRGKTFVLLPTAGHTPGHVAIITPDRVCHIGDTMMALRELSAAKLPFMEDASCSLLSIQTILDTDYPLYVAAHSGCILPQDLPEVGEQNTQKELDLYAALLQLIDRPGRPEDFVVPFMCSLGIARPHVLQHPGWHATVRRRIQELVISGELVEENGIVRPVRYH